MMPQAARRLVTATGSRSGNRRRKAAVNPDRRAWMPLNGGTRRVWIAWMTNSSGVIWARLWQERPGSRSVRAERRHRCNGLTDELPADGRSAAQRKGLGGGELRGIGTGRHLTLGQEQGDRDPLLVEGDADEGDGGDDISQQTREDDVKIHVEGRRRQQRR